MPPTIKSKLIQPTVITPRNLLLFRNPDLVIRLKLLNIRTDKGLYKSSLFTFTVTFNPIGGILPDIKYTFL